MEEDNTEMMYQYRCRSFDDAAEAELWMNEAADEGYRLEKILLRKEGQEVWVFMERADEIEVDLDED